MPRTGRRRRNAWPSTKGWGRREGVRFALIHQECIDRFGRFPHRNVILGRETTPEEADYLANGGFTG